MDDRLELTSLIKNSFKAEQWIIQGIKEVKIGDLDYAIKHNLPADKLLLAHFDRYISNPVLSPLIRAILKTHWSIAEKYLCDVSTLYKILTENRPEFARLLGNKEGIAWLTMGAKKGYQFIYGFCWR